MEEKKQEVLEQWLLVEFHSIANKAGLITQRKLVDEKLIMDSVRCLDHESIIELPPSINYIITLIGLMWEHVDHNKYDLRQIIIKFLSRVGYPTSAIICDRGFSKEECSFTCLNSKIDEVSIALDQVKNEVTVGEKRYLLTDFQIKIWDSMDKDKILGISAPTSAGKSFVILLKIIKKLIKENLDIVYIVPTLSLLNQVTEDFNCELKKQNAFEYRICSSFNENYIYDKRNIYVLTQEKAIAAFSESDKPFAKKLILVADEIQNIERIKEDEGDRAKILYDTLVEFRDKENVEQIIISGPRIEQIDKVGEKIFGFETINHTTEICPVLNLTYSIKKLGKKYYLKQYCSLTKEPIEKEIDNPVIIEGYGGKKYNNKYLSYLNDFVWNVGSGSQNIIFAPTSDTARKIALSMSGQSTKTEKDLIDYYSSTIRPNYSLCKTLEKGVAYHHGKLPMHVRRTLEKAISEKKISNVVCTTTLLQGVNLPAQNVFVRNPHLYINKKSETTDLTNYEMANLRGRAGRLLKDYIGRTYVMDENEFTDTEGYEQMELFENVTKELPTGYEQCFGEYYNEIEDAIINDKPVDSTMKKYGYIISYIRQSILRYGDKSQQKMKNVGIKLSKNQVAAILLKLEKLTVPKHICYKNRYWDPLVLGKIYLDFNEELPNTPMEKGLKAKIDKVMLFLRDTKETTDMYDKYVPKDYRKGMMRGIMISQSIQWSKGTPLCEILENPRYDGEEGADNIDGTIALLQNTISFSMPLLLKPIYDMRKPESIFLTCMQAGAISNTVRCKIEMGIPRETALSLFKNEFENKECKADTKMELEDAIRDKIKVFYDELTYWTKVQLDFLL